MIPPSSAENPAPQEPHPALGVDYGDVRIGVAVTDPLGILPHPLETIDRRREDPLARLTSIVGQRGIRTVVVGLPLRMDGSEGDSARKVRAFASQLQSCLHRVPVVFQDETLTTATAAEKLREAGRNARQQKGLIDQAAAVEILKTWMQQLAPTDLDLTCPPEPEFDARPASSRRRQRR